MIRKIFLSVALLGIVSSAHASVGNAEPKGWIGGMFGLHIPDADHTTARAAWGVTGGAKMGSEIGLGAYYMSSSKEETINALPVDFDYSLVGVEVTYMFEGEASGMYLGGRVGLTSIDVGSYKFNPYHWGALVGYNHFLAPTISLGGEGCFFSVPRDTDTATVGNLSATQTQNAFHIVSVMATAKFWF